MTIRLLTFDLDNTLWGGVIGDDGVEALAMGQDSPEGEAFTGYQQQMVKETAAPFRLGNATETLTNPVVSALAKKDCLSKKTADLTVSSKPSKTIG